MTQQHISMQLPTDLACRARVEAARRNISRSEFVLRAIESALAQGEPIAPREEVKNAK